MMWDDGHYYFGWPGMLLFLVAFWSVMGAGVYLGARWLGRDLPTMHALDVLDQRLARGEIDIDEYARRWQAISDHQSSAVGR